MTVEIHEFTAGPFRGNIVLDDFKLKAIMNWNTGETIPIGDFSDAYWLRMFAMAAMQAMLEKTDFLPGMCVEISEKLLTSIKKHESEKK